MTRIAPRFGPRRRARIGRVLRTVLAAAVLGAALGQIQLTRFQSGEPIVASEVNANFDALKNAVEGAQERVTALEGDVRRVSYVDLVPLSTVDLETSGDVLAFTRTDTKLGYLALLGTDGTFCFAARLNLPDGAIVTAFTATALDQVGDDVDVLLRAWGSTSVETLTGIDAGTTDAFPDTLATVAAPAGELPTDLDATTYEHRVDVCLSGENAGFLDAAIHYDVP